MELQSSSCPGHHQTYARAWWSPTLVPKFFLASGSGFQQTLQCFGVAYYKSEHRSDYFVNLFGMSTGDQLYFKTLLKLFSRKQIVFETKASQNQFYLQSSKVSDTYFLLSICNGRDRPNMKVVERQEASVKCATGVITEWEHSIKGDLKHSRGVARRARGTMSRAPKSPNNVVSTFFRDKFTPKTPYVRTWVRQTCFLHRAPSNLDMGDSFQSSGGVQSGRLRIWGSLHSGAAYCTIKRWLIIKCSIQS